MAWWIDDGAGASPEFDLFAGVVRDGVGEAGFWTAGQRSRWDSLFSGVAGYEEEEAENQDGDQG